jgi:hypothetical protein
VNFSSHQFLLTLARDVLLSQQALMAFFLEHLRPFEQCFRTGFNGIAWCFEMCSGEEALAGEFVVLVSHLNLGGKLQASIFEYANHRIENRGMTRA